MLLHLGLYYIQGRTSNPTPKSDTARFSNNVFTALDIINGLLRASIVTMFKRYGGKIEEGVEDAVGDE